MRVATVEKKAQQQCVIARNRGQWQVLLVVVVVVVVQKGNVRLLQARMHDIAGLADTYAHVHEGRSIDSVPRACSRQSRCKRLPLV